MMDSTEAWEALSSMKSLHRSLRITPVKRSQHFFFNMIEFRFFKDSEQGVALPFGNSGFLTRLVAVPYVLAAEVIFFRARRYFVKLGESVVGVVVFREEPDNLLIGSLGVAKEYRRLGVATFVLRCAEQSAARLGKEWLELSVLKRNVPARRLYAEFGFRWRMTRKWSLILRKKVALV
jgi:ribosomal protein S18 acetylase RimI-like enzyme